jgi:hypothetical protein
VLALLLAAAGHALLGDLSRPPERRLMRRGAGEGWRCRPGSAGHRGRAEPLPRGRRSARRARCAADGRLSHSAPAARLPTPPPARQARLPCCQVVVPVDGNRRWSSGPASQARPGAFFVLRCSRWRLARVTRWRRLTRRLRRSEHGCRRRRAAFRHPVEADGTDESSLARAQPCRREHRPAEAQRRVLASASHELRSPWPAGMAFELLATTRSPAASTRRRGGRYRGA